MQITIHRGSKEIGGTCIQLSTENTTILLDAGLPLSESSAFLDLSKIKADALLISHPHQDHYGLMEELPSYVSIHVGELAKGLIEAPRPFLKQPLPHNTFRYLSPNKTFDIGDFQITPYLVDHSTPEAYAFLVESRQGVRVFYSGDLRGHGRKGFLFEDLIKNPPENIDALFLEGTMMRRGLGEFSNEKAVEETIVDVLKKQQNISFLITSSQNVDRIISASNACKRSGKVLVIDFYTAWILEQMKKVSRRVTAMEWDNVRVYAHYSHDQALKNNQGFFGDFRKRAYRYRITKDELMESAKTYLWIGKMSQFRIMDIYKQFGPINVIYSQWKGYLENSSGKCYGAEQVAAYRDDPLVNYVYAHTSGHAPIDDLQRFATAIKPRILVPVHTVVPEDYKDYFENVQLVQDEQVVLLKEDRNMCTEIPKSDIEKKLKDKQEKRYQRPSARWPSKLKLFGASTHPDSYHLALDGESICKNMQEDSAAFEGWALVLRSWLGAAKVVVSWPEPKDVKATQALHYQRFLYRVIKFKNSMNEWFEVKDESLLDKSRVLCPDGNFRDGNFLLNYENKERKGGDSKNSDSEDALEKNFYDNPDTLLNTTKANELKRQLPVGLFEGAVKKNTENSSPQIFPGGKAAIDLWSLADDGRVAIYELKKPKSKNRNNKKVGAISELFFYTCLIRDTQTQNNLNFYYEKTKSKEDKIKYCELIKNRKGVIGYILMDEIHPLLDSEKIFSELNIKFNKSGISFGFVEYNIVDNKIDRCRLKY